MVDTFESLSQEVMEELTRNHRAFRLEPGEVFFTPHDEDRERLFVLKEGRIRIYKLDPEGREIALSVAVEGKIFGQMSLTAQRLGEAYAKAVEPSVVFVLSREDLEAFLRSNPEAGICLIRQLCERLGQLVVQI
jgi:CRP-like cAMP-binding protein